MTEITDEAHGACTSHAIFPSVVATVVYEKGAHTNNDSSIDSQSECPTALGKRTHLTGNERSPVWRTCWNYLQMLVSYRCSANIGMISVMAWFH